MCLSFAACDLQFLPGRNNSPDNQDQITHVHNKSCNQSSHCMLHNEMGGGGILFRRYLHNLKIGSSKLIFTVDNLLFKPSEMCIQRRLRTMINGQQPPVQNASCLVFRQLAAVPSHIITFN
jgi:hypothetical protein